MNVDKRHGSRVFCWVGKIDKRTKRQRGCTGLQDLEIADFGSELANVGSLVDCYGTG